MAGLTSGSRRMRIRLPSTAERGNHPIPQRASGRFAIPGSEVQFRTSSIQQPQFVDTGLSIEIGQAFEIFVYRAVADDLDDQRCCPDNLGQFVPGKTSRSGMQRGPPEPPPE